MQYFINYSLENKIGPPGPVRLNFALKARPVAWENLPKMQNGLEACRKEEKVKRMPKMDFMECDHMYLHQDSNTGSVLWLLSYKETQ